MASACLPTPCHLPLMNNWLGLLICLLYIFSIIGLAEGLRRWRGYSSDFTRKVIHIGVGMMSWGLHWLFDNPWFFIAACAAFMVLNFLDWRYGFVAAMSQWRPFQFRHSLLSFCGGHRGLSFLGYTATHGSRAYAPDLGRCAWLQWWDGAYGRFPLQRLHQHPHAGRFGRFLCLLSLIHLAGLVAHPWLSRHFPCNDRSPRLHHHPHYHLCRGGVHLGVR